MKKGVLLFLLVGILSLAVCYGDVVNISYIHEHFEDLKGKEVNVTGVVTAKFKNNLIVIQDKTAGIWLWNSDKNKFSNVEVGDEINVLGKVKDFNGLREIEVTKIEILSHNNPLPDPKIVKIKDIKYNKSLMGTLVKLCKVKVTEVSGKKFVISDETEDIEGYFKYNDYLTLKVGDVINLTAVVGCYKHTIQVYPRSNEDIEIYQEKESNPTKTPNYGSIFFIHLADIHLCSDDEVDEVFEGTVPPVTTTKEAVKEVIGFQPEVVVQTGDIVALADRYDLDTDERWYKLVNVTIYTPINKRAGIPFLFAPGNHDPAGIKLNDVSKSDPRYGNGLLLKYLLSDKGRTYYSYDYGRYHFVIIDPVETKESGYRAVRLPKEQLDWLKSDLENNSDKFIIICYHQPLGSWEYDSYRKFLDVVKKYKGHILLIAGHTHDNRLMTVEGVPEHQGGAVCGDWWQTGKTPDGNPLGYVIYYIDNGTIYRFYKGIGNTAQINLHSPRDVVLNGTTPIELNVYYENKTIVNISYKIDNGTLHPLNFTLINVTKTWWYNAKGDLAITPEMIDDRKHNITIVVIAKDGSTFNRTFYYKFSNTPIMKIAEIIDDKNFQDYYGLFAVINGTITEVARNGNELIIKDDSGEIVVWAGDCKHDDFIKGQKVILRGQITQFKGTKELKLIRGSDVKIYGFENISEKVIVLPDIETAYKNFSKLKNKYVEVRGVTTAVFGDLIAIQDNTRGIEVWLGKIKHDPIKLGDVITVRGKLTTYYNMIEIVVGREEDLIINGSAPVPAPKEITINEIPENLGNLVIVKGLTVKSVDSKKIKVSDGINTTTIYCKKAGFDPTKVVKVGDKIDVIGIAHLYKKYYEILPRSKEDIIFSTTSNGKIITLKKGWNPISIPHRANVSFSDPEAVGSIITYYNNTWYNKSNLEPLYGYYIYCYNDTYMNIKFITPEKPTAPPQRPVFKGWNLVGVNPGKNDINGVRLIDFVLPVEDSWIMIIDLDGNVYDKNDNLSNILLHPYEVYWMYCKKDDILAGRGLN